MNSDKIKSVVMLILKIIFFPFVLIFWGFRAFSSKIRFNLTAKTTLIFTVLFALAMLLYTIFLISSIQNRLGEGQEGYFAGLWLTTILLMLIVTAVIAAVGALASEYMLSPIRRMTKQLNGITGENLSARIDTQESQDELRDLTHRINRMLQDLEQSFERQQHFVSDASHELRTPIAVIQGYINLLRRWGKEKPEILEEAIDTIARESENMKHLTEQLLFLTGLGTFKPTEELFDVAPVIEEMINAAHTLSTHRFAFEPAVGQLELFTNKDMYSQTLRILIDNAVKYTPPDGKITVRASRNEGNVVVEVQDTGIGISEEDLPKIFDRFYRCDRARSREKGGSGLGLAIAKSIIDVLGGTISVVSGGAWHGTKFTVTLPAAQPDVPDEE